MKNDREIAFERVLKNSLDAKELSAFINTLNKAYEVRVLESVSAYLKTHISDENRQPLTMNQVIELSTICREEIIDEMRQRFNIYLDDEAKKVQRGEHVKH